MDDWQLVLSEIDLTVIIALSGLLLAILFGSLGSKFVGRQTFCSIILFGVVLPVVLSIIHIQLMTHVEIMNWPRAGGRYTAITPLTAILVSSWFGGILGLYAGKIWGEENDKSCLQCLLQLFLLILLGSLIAAIIL